MLFYDFYDIIKIIKLVHRGEIMPILTEKSINTFLDLVRLRHEETGFHRLTLDAEKELLNKVRSGDFQSIHVPAFEKLREGFGLVSTRPRKTYEYYTASAVALFSRTAMEAGVEADDALDLADALLLMLADAKSDNEIHDIFVLSAVMFAKQVSELQANTGPYLVRKAQNYIRRNLFHTLTIAEVAEYVERSPNYLSQIFRNQTGITIHNYIQKERISVAKNLLATTDRPISEISVYLGFESPANFSVVFKKWEKISPSEFRNRMYHEVY